MREPNPQVGIAERLLGLCCVYDGDDDPLDPGYSGFVPCKWTGPLPKKPCMAEVLEDDLGTDIVGLDVLPGLCDPAAQGSETMMSIQNNGPLPITIEKRQMVAVGQALTPGLVWVRRDVNPETGEEPEVLYTDESGELCSVSLEGAYSQELDEATTLAEAQEEWREECRFKETQGLPMYQTDDKTLAWKPVPEDDASSHASTAASNSETMPSNGVESFN